MLSINPPQPNLATTGLLVLMIKLDNRHCRFVVVN